MDSNDPPTKRFKIGPQSEASSSSPSLLQLSQPGSSKANENVSSFTTTDCLLSDGSTLKPAESVPLTGTDLLIDQNVKFTQCRFKVTELIRDKLLPKNNLKKMIEKWYSEKKLYFGWSTIKKYTEMSMITDKIGLTSLGEINEENVSTFSCQVKLVLNISFEAPLLKVNGIECFRIPVEDPDNSLHLFFNQVVDKMNKVISSGSSVIVHCWRGQSRSASVIIAYLMKAQNLNLENAFNKVRQVRKVSPNLLFLKQLRVYERSLPNVLEKSPWVVVKMNEFEEELPSFIANRIYDFSVYKRLFKKK